MLNLKWTPLGHPVYGVCFTAIVLVTRTGCRRHVPLLDGPPRLTRLLPIMLNNARGIYFAEYPKGWRGVRNGCVGENVKRGKE